MGFIAAIAALLTAGVVYQQIGARRERRRFAPPGRLIDVGGHRLHVTCSGIGSPVVLLESGIAASSLSWAVVQPQIAAFTRVCSYDRAGLAWSEPASCPRTFERMVDELETGTREHRPRRTLHTRWPFIRQLPHIGVRCASQFPSRRTRAGGSRDRVACDDDAAPGATSLGWPEAVTYRCSAGTCRRCPCMPGASYWRCARGAPPVRQNLRSDCSTYAGTAGW